MIGQISSKHIVYSVVIDNQEVDILIEALKTLNRKIFRDQQVNKLLVEFENMKKKENEI